jgi:hypothetical protein
VKDKRKSRRKDKSQDKSFTGWGRALAEARYQLGVCRVKAKQLQGSIRIINQKIAEREPWPDAGVQELDRKKRANG